MAGSVRGLIDRYIGGSAPGPQPVASIGGMTVAPSSFGLNNTQLGPDFDVNTLYKSYRVQELEFREKFFQCTQHDHKTHDFDGRFVGSGRIAGTQPLIGGSLPSTYVSLTQRRPSAPYRLGRKIVNSFTSMVFGKGHWPELVSDDPDTRDFADALCEEMNLPAKMIRVRNIGGGCGTVGISWQFVNGKPRVTIHQGKHLHVLEWEDEEEGIPSHVMELYVTTREKYDSRKKKNEQKFYWVRRDWTKKAYVVFQDVEVKKDNPHWFIDEEKSTIHEDGFTHFVFIRNLPDDEVGTSDGQPDYAEVYEQMNTIDTLNSVICRGAILNLDPTLVLAMNQEDVEGMIVKKGSDNALAVGPGGNASYMELSGTSITAGKDLVASQREQVLESVECVVPDPNEVAAAGTSSVALKMLYHPMLGKSDILRDQYGMAIVRLLMQMIDSARRLLPLSDPSLPDEERFVHEISFDEETGEEIDEPVEYYLNLPPRIERSEILDEAGNPTGEETVTKHDRLPGNGNLELEWPDYFKATADDKSKQASALVLATGGKPVLSQKTAVEKMAHTYGTDPEQEWLAVAEEAEAARQGDAMMYPSPGGEVEQGEDLPPGAEADPESSSEPESPPGG